MGGNCASGFADVPFNGMEPITAVAYVCAPDVFAGSQKIFDAFRNERAERNLKRERADVDVVGAACRRVQIDAVAANADAVGKDFGRDVGGRGSLGSAHLRADVLFEDGEFGLDAAGLA